MADELRDPRGGLAGRDPAAGPLGAARRSREHGLHPDGRPAPPAAGVAFVERTAIADALRVPSFWLLTAGLFNCGFSMSLLSAHGVPMLTDHGFPP